MQSKTKIIAVGVTAIIVATYLIGSYIYKKKKSLASVDSSAADENKSAIRNTHDEEKNEEGVYAPDWAGFTDPDFESNHYLTKKEAENRSTLISDVNY